MEYGSTHWPYNRLVGIHHWNQAQINNEITQWNLSIIDYDYKTNEYLLLHNNQYSEHNASLNGMFKILKCEKKCVIVTYGYTSSES